MQYIYDFIKKLLGIKEAITIILIGLNIVFYSALSIFIIKLVEVLYDLYELIKQLFDKGTSGILAGSSGDNDFNAIAWSMLDAYGILDVFNVFLPLIYSSLVMYLTFFSIRLILDFKSKIQTSLYEVGMIIGS